MRKYPSRLTRQCPICGGQLVVHVRFPIPEHVGIKQPELIDFRCTPTCPVTESDVRRLFRLQL